MEILVSKNEEEVYVLDKVLQRMDEDMLVIVKTVISNMTLVTQTQIKMSFDMGYIVGKSKCVEVRKEDKIKWLWMKNKGDRIPFVMDRDGEDTSFITIIIEKREDVYYLIAAYYGEAAPMTHKDAAHRGMSESYIKKCYAFWHTHALVYDEALVDLKRSKRLLG